MRRLAMRRHAVRRLAVRRASGAYPVQVDFDTRVGCYAWIERDGSVLLTRWAGWVAPNGRVLRPCWTLPGGGLELHENVEQAVVREVAEETGYAVELLEMIGSGSHVVPTSERFDPEAERPFLLLQLIYRAQVVAGDLAVEVDGSTDDARWVPLGELSTLTCSGVIDLALGLVGREPRDGPVIDEEPVAEEAVRQILEAVPGLVAPRGGTNVIALDGPSGSGKTSLARVIAADLGAPLVQMDDLYPGWDGLAAAVDLVTDRVLEPLSRGGRATYQAWDWETSDWGRTLSVPPVDLVVIEGCGSTVGRAGEYAALRVWVDADEQVRHQRGIERDGDTFAPHWDRWAAQERALFGADRTADRADLTVRT